MGIEAIPLRAVRNLLLGRMGMVIVPNTIRHSWYVILLAVFLTMMCVIYGC
jgi:hypothetical protein